MAVSAPSARFPYRYRIRRNIMNARKLFTVTAASLLTAAALMAQGSVAERDLQKALMSERDLQKVLTSDTPITDLAIMMEIGSSQLNMAEYRVTVSTKIPGTELALAHQAGADTTTMDYLGQVHDQYGAVVANFRDKASIKLSGMTAAQLGQKPMQYDTTLTLLRGPYTIKFVARNSDTGRIGTYEQRFNVPASGAAPVAGASGGGAFVQGFVAGQDARTISSGQSVSTYTFSTGGRGGPGITGS